MRFEVVVENFEMAYLVVENLAAHQSNYPEIDFLTAKTDHCYLISMIDLDDSSSPDYKCWNMENC